MNKQYGDFLKYNAGLFQHQSHFCSFGHYGKIILTKLIDDI